MKRISILLIALAFFTFIGNAYSAVIYVDNVLSNNCTAGNYSISNRSCSGSDGNAWRSIQEAINAMTPGDTIYMRGGTYYPTAQTVECIRIPPSKNGSGWSQGRYNKLASYPGEWAIIDGQNSCGSRGVGLGAYDATFDGSIDIKYWVFERFEIRNARSADGQFSWGLFVNGGPNYFRYLYIHNNQATTGANNPFGLGGYHWQNSVVEYCFFRDNGVTPASTADTNPAHIGVFSDYNWASIASNGWYENSSRVSTYKNEYRYNYMYGGNVGFKHKGAQFLTGRTNPGSGFSDARNTYGDKFHHNIIVNTLAQCIGAHQDFMQVYNNICDNTGRGLNVQYQNNGGFYKVVLYNNTIMNNTMGGIIRFMYSDYSNEILQHYGWDYNNILDNITSYSGYCTYNSLALCEGTAPQFDLSNYHSNNNYFYRSPTSSVYSMRRSGYTASAFESQTLTGAPRNVYANAYSSGNPLYYGTSGADKYRARGAHILENVITISNGGAGIAHPYLAGTYIPSYVGATNPSDDRWVSGVLSLSSVATLMSGGSGDPDWIEGSTQPPSPIPPVTTLSPPAGLRIMQ